MPDQFSSKIKGDIQDALRQADALRAETLRLLLASIQSREIENRGKKGEATLTDEEAISVVRKEIKKRKEAAELFRRGNREDLAGKEDKERLILEAYAPSEISEEELMLVIKNMFKKGNDDFASLMRESMKELKGKADGSVVSVLVKKVLDAK